MFLKAFVREFYLFEISINVNIVVYIFSCCLCIVFTFILVVFVVVFLFTCLPFFLCWCLLLYYVAFIDNFNVKQGKKKTSESCFIIFVTIFKRNLNPKSLLPSSRRRTVKNTCWYYDGGHCKLCLKKNLIFLHFHTQNTYFFFCFFFFLFFVLPIDWKR